MDRPIEEEWRNFELYEKVRIREHRKRLLLVTVTLLGFLGLCSVPVVEERLPKWESLRAAQRLSVEIEKLKLIAIQEKKPVRMHFSENGHFQMDVISDCQSTIPIKVIREGSWPNVDGELKILSADEAKTFSLRLANEQICFDPVFGLDGVKTKRVLVIAPVKDLSESRLDRASYVILEGESAKISIN